MDFKTAMKHMESGSFVRAKSMPILDYLFKTQYMSVDNFTYYHFGDENRNLPVLLSQLDIHSDWEFYTYRTLLMELRVGDTFKFYDSEKEFMVVPEYLEDFAPFPKGADEILIIGKNTPLCSRNKNTFVIKTKK